MTATPACKLWCTNHQVPDECYTRFTIYDDGEEEGRKPAPPGSTAAPFEFPKDIGWISFVGSQDEEDEQPIMELHLFEAGADEPIVKLPLDMNALKELHANFGAIIRNFS
jgi:hypothetical protein